MRTRMSRDSLYNSPYKFIYSGLRYYIYDKSNWQLKDSITLIQNLDTSYIHSNIIERGDTMNIYYHMVMAHSSSWDRSLLMRLRISPSGQVIDTTQLIDQVVPLHFFDNPTYYTEHRDTLHQIYNDIVLGKCYFRLFHKKYDLSGNELSFERLNPFIKDTCDSPLGLEFSSEIKELKGNYYMIAYGVHVDSSMKYYGLGTYGYMLHFDSSFNFIQGVSLMIDSTYDVYSGGVDLEWLPANVSLPNLLDFNDSNYVYGGKGRYETELSHNNFYSTCRNILAKSSRTYNPLPELKQVYYAEAPDYYSDWLFYPYFEFNLENLNFGSICTDIKGAQAGAKDYVLYSTDKYSQDRSRTWIEVVGRDFIPKYSIMISDSVMVNEVKGVLQAEDGKLIVYGTTWDRAIGTIDRYLTQPYLLLLSEDGFPLSVFNAQHTQVTESLEVYPNPTTHTLHIKEDVHLLGKHYTVTAIDGQQVLTGIYRGSIDLQSLPVGAYILTLSQGNKQHIAKFVKRE